MARKFIKETRFAVFFAIIFTGYVDAAICRADEESAIFRAEPVTSSSEVRVIEVKKVEPVKKESHGLAKLLGKTMKGVSAHNGSAPQSKSAGKMGYREQLAVRKELAPRLFDPQRRESPIRTARLFKIQFNDAEANESGLPNGLLSDR